MSKIWKINFSSTCMAYGFWVDSWKIETFSITFVPGRIFTHRHHSMDVYDVKKKTHSRAVQRERASKHRTFFPIKIRIRSFLSPFRIQKKGFHSFFFVLLLTSWEEVIVHTLLCYPVFEVTELQKEISCKVNLRLMWDAFFTERWCYNTFSVVNFNI